MEGAGRHVRPVSSVSVTDDAEHDRLGDGLETVVAVELRDDVLFHHLHFAGLDFESAGDAARRIAFRHQGEAAMLGGCQMGAGRVVVRLRLVGGAVR